MEYSDDLFPFRTVLSLEPLIAYWQEIEKDPSPVKSGLAKHVLKEL